jgi:hypothetical protein
MNAPTDLRARVFDALCADIQDGKPSLRRVDALREIIKQNRESGVGNLSRDDR